MVVGSTYQPFSLFLLSSPSLSLLLSLSSHPAPPAAVLPWRASPAHPPGGAGPRRSSSSPGGSASPRRPCSSLRRHAGRPRRPCNSIGAAGEAPPLLLQSSIPTARAPLPARAPLLDAWSTAGQIEPRHLLPSHPELELPAKSIHSALSPNPPASAGSLSAPARALERMAGRGGEECSTGGRGTRSSTTRQCGTKRVVLDGVGFTGHGTGTQARWWWFPPPRGSPVSRACTRR